MAEKTPMQELADKILVKRQFALKSYDESEVNAFADDYIDFLSNNKTEREVINAVLEEVKKQGFVDLNEVDSVEKNGKYYVRNGDKNLALITFSGLHRVHALASHADSPCLHLKPYPLTESNNMALLKTHYYGGVKKYQWLNIPLALHGVAYTSEGKRVNFRIGESDSDPVFNIPDLLPHLARDQMKKTARELVTGEQLNPIVGTEGVDDDAISEKVKLAVAKHLYDTYGLVEKDLVSAELIFVPAGRARYAGFDKSLIVGYGHDDRSSVYTTLRAHLSVKEAPHTIITLFYDKEEIGSEGKTGAKSSFFTALFEELIDKSSSDLRTTQVWRNTRVISADVTSAINPNFSDVQDPSNVSYLGYGVAIEKYGGGGGKYSTNDADAEFVHSLISLYEKHKVPWQSGENGKIDVGGGGTIAMFLSMHGADVIDMGVSVLGMHAPYELTHKADIYSAYKAYKTFIENEF